MFVVLNESVKSDYQHAQQDLPSVYVSDSFDLESVHCLFTCVCFVLRKCKE